MLALWFGVDRSTITRAIGEVRPLLAQRGCTVAPDVRLRVLQPGPAGQQRRHHAGATAGTVPAPGRRPVHGDPRGCRLPGGGCADTGVPTRLAYLLPGFQGRVKRGGLPPFLITWVWLEVVMTCRGPTRGPNSSLPLRWTVTDG
ncbi:hypothetical protein ACFW88_31355 [Streptomyces anandii]|uniref:Transposase Helix-turn-helix domain-containing protein n=1 Tax=Streptomyces anandii TaxID=285454 RepID=A0ABW6HED4_9ACTN